MAHQNGMISSPVSLHADVYPTLGIGPHEGRYDLAWANSNLHGATNKWAKYKPERYASPEVLTDAQRAQNMFGMDVPYSSNIDTVIQAARKGDWDYLPPVPLQDRQRQTDWEGYYHYSVRPCTSILGDAQGEASQSEALVIHFNSSVDAADREPNNLSLYDVEVQGQALGDGYLCIVVLDEQGNKMFGATSEHNFRYNWTLNPVRIIMNAANYWTKGLYTMVPLVSSTQRSACFFKNGGRWTGGWYAALPAKPSRLTVRAWDDIDFRCEARWVYSGGKRSSVSYDFYAQNLSDAAVNIGTVHMRFGRFDDRDLPPAKVYLWDYDVDNGRNITIPANSQEYDTRLGGSINESMTGEAFDDNDEYFIELTFETSYVNDYTYSVLN